MEPIFRTRGAIEAIDLRTMLFPLPALKETMPLLDAAEFLNRSGCHFAAVESEKGVIGLCSRSGITSLLGTRFGFALNARSVVGDVLEPDYLAVRLGDPIVSILSRAFERGEDAFWQDVIVTDEEGSYLGLLKAHALAKLQSRLLGEKVEHLEQRQSELERATQRLKQSNHELEIARDRGLAAARAKSEFLAVMSHEIRTPLNGVIGMITLLGDSSLNRDQQELLQTANDSAEALLMILNDILDFSRLESGKIELEERRFNVRELAESVLTLMAESAQESGLEVICDIDTEVPQSLVSDSGRIRQILANLLGNAVKFTDRGEICLRLRKDCVAGACRGLRFEVEDSGIGISREAQERLFQPFVQADSSTTRRFGGTGLGLAICAQLVKAMGGEIGVESEVGKGSRFWFTIACSNCEEASEVYRPKAFGEKKVALLLVDSPRVAAVLERELAIRNIAALSGRSERFCREILSDSSRRIDLVIVESHMMKSEIGRLTRELPSIVLYPSHGSEVEEDAAGKRAHLCKPVRPSKLDRCLRLALTEEVAMNATFEPGAGGREACCAPVIGCEPPKAKVLVVEDNAVNRRLVTHLVSKFGYDCHQAEDGIEALEACEREVFDVILLDCRMPRMDGHAFARALREKERQFGAGRRMPVIALTANALQGDRELCFAAGMDAYLTKPVKKARLKELLEQAVAGELRRSLAAAAAITVGECSLEKG